MTLDWLLARTDILLQIIGINLILSGDNALMIAMASQGLPKSQERWVIGLGVSAALFFRIILSLGLWRLLEIPGLHLIGGLILLVIALQLSETREKAGKNAPAVNSLGLAIRQIIIADAVMSADNVLAVTAAAKGDPTLLVIGLVLCIPFIVLGSGLLGQLIKRWPFILVLGSTLLGWIAGQLLNSDVTLDDLKMPVSVQDALPAILSASVFIIAFSRWLRLNRSSRIV